MDISGSTITYTHEQFPIKNLPILKLSMEEESQGAVTIAKSINEKLDWFQYEGELQNVAIALNGKTSPTFTEVQDIRCV